MDVFLNEILPKQGAFAFTQGSHADMQASL